MKKILMVLAAVVMMVMPVFLSTPVWAQFVSGRDYSSCNNVDDKNDPERSRYQECAGEVNTCYGIWGSGRDLTSCLDKVKQKYGGGSGSNPGYTNPSTPGSTYNPGTTNTPVTTNEGGDSTSYDTTVGADMSGDNCVETSIFGPVCPDSEGGGIFNILNLVLNILTAGVGIAATIGFVIAGIQYLTAQDNEGQVAKAKMRMFQIVIGLFVYATMWAILNWILPGGVFGGQ